MAEFKINVGDPKTGKTVNFVLNDQQSKALYGKKISQKIPGDLIGHDGYEFEITGGSDNCGFPMRKDVEGANRKRLLITGGVGFKPKRKGERRRKSVAGNMVMPKTAQVNLKILKQGKKPLTEAAPAKEKAPKEEAKPEAKAKEEAKPEVKEESPKPEAKEEAKPEVKEESPKPEAKEEPKSEAKKETKPEEASKEEAKPEVPKE